MTPANRRGRRTGPRVMVFLLVGLVAASCGGSDSADTSSSAATSEAPSTTAVATTAAPTATPDQGDLPVLLIARSDSIDLEYMLEQEVSTMLSMFDDAGIEIVVATLHDEPIVGNMMTLEPQVALNDVVIGDYAGVIMPCMAAGFDYTAGSLQVAKDALAAGVPIAAQYGSVYTLAAAGALSERPYAFGEELAPFYFDEGPPGVYSGTGVVQDGNVITSGTCSYKARETGRPDGTSELTRMFIDAIQP